MSALLRLLRIKYAAFLAPAHAKTLFALGDVVLGVILYLGCRVIHRCGGVILFVVAGVSLFSKKLNRFCGLGLWLNMLIQADFLFFV